MEIAKLLLEACGKGLAACSWEMAMKEFLSVTVARIPWD
jgi:hypothetical protein